MTITLLTVTEAAAILQCTEQWLARAAARGEVPSRKVGRRRMFTESDVADYLERVREGRDPWALTPQQQAALDRPRRSA